MDISRNWIQEYFDEALPSSEKIQNTLTMHSFEVGGFDIHENDTLFHIDILPNRASDCLSHRGVAREIGALFNLSLKRKAYAPLHFGADISISIEDGNDCSRYIAVPVRNVSLGETPKNIKEKLDVLGQRSINGAVDLANFVMFDMGQPLHVFDADKIVGGIAIRRARKGEVLTTLDNKEIILNENMLIIADDKGPLALAGIKGGKRAEVTRETKNIIIEAAHFKGSVVRKTARTLPLLTDASKRFENGISPSYAEIGATELARLLEAHFGGMVGEATDVYLKKPGAYVVGGTISEIKDILGMDITREDIAEVMNRLGWGYGYKENPREDIVRRAETLLGKPYKYGASVAGDAPNAFDCSSFTAYLSAQAGISIPRMAVDQFMFGDAVEEKDIIPGDFVFSNTKELKRKIDFASIEFLPGKDAPTGVDHLGVYVGDGYVIHATEKGEGVVVKEKINESAQFKNVIGFRRMRGIDDARFIFEVPDDRLDIKRSTDVSRIEHIAEEIGRMVGYEKLPLTPLGNFSPSVHTRTLIESMLRRALVEKGFSEVSTYVFRKEGERSVENPMAEGVPFLRTTLSSGLEESFEKNKPFKDLLGLSRIALFEIGTIFSHAGEAYVLGILLEKNKKQKTLGEYIQELKTETNISLEENVVDRGSWEFVELSLDSLVVEKDSYGSLFSPESALEKYARFSSYPYVVRDFAVFTPLGTEESVVREIITLHAGPLAVHIRLFDVFEKETEGVKKISYAFRVIFQSFEKTLSDEEVNQYMNAVYDALRKQEGYVIR